MVLEDKGRGTFYSLASESGDRHSLFSLRSFENKNIILLGFMPC